MKLRMAATFPHENLRVSIFPYCIAKSMGTLHTNSSSGASATSTAGTGSRMGHTEELSDFKHGTRVGCNLSHKSVCELSPFLDLHRPTISAIIVKWKCLEATTAQPQSD